MKRNDELINNTFEATIQTLQKSPELRPDPDRRAFYTIGIMQSFLEQLSESSRFNNAQRAQLVRIVETWDKAMFPTMAITKEEV
jgi:hypothetical protein